MDGTLQFGSKRANHGERVKQTSDNKRINLAKRNPEGNPNMRRPITSILTITLLASGLYAAEKIQPSDRAVSEARQHSWTSWRGPMRDGISGETGLQSQWPEGGPKLEWQVNGLGNGFSSVAIANGRIITMGKIDGSSHVVALSQEDGSKLWQTSISGGNNPNCTPTIDGNRVYALTNNGNLACLDVESGEILWKKNFAADFGGKMESGWGYSESPLVDGDRLVCTPGGRENMIVALNKETGAKLWSTSMPEAPGNKGQDGAAYSSVVIGNGGGVRQYVQLTGRGVFGIDTKSGKVLWQYNRIANGTANIPTPIVKGDYVFCSTGYNTGAALLKINRSGNSIAAQEVYFLEPRDVQNHHGGMILLGDHIYMGHGHNQGFPLCIEMLTGKVKWRPGRGVGQRSAAIIYADGHLYFRYESGEMALIEATPDEYKVKGQFRLNSVNGASWPHPVIAGKKLYLRDQNNLMCYDIAR